MRLAAIDRLAQQRQLARVGHADQHRQHLRGPRRHRETDAGLREVEPCRLVAHDQVAQDAELDALTRRPAMHRGDEDLVGPTQRPHDLEPCVTPRPTRKRMVLGIRQVAFGEVPPPRKGFTAAGEDHDSDFLVAACSLQCREQVALEPGREGVHLFRPVEPDQRHVLVWLLVLDQHVPPMALARLHPCRDDPLPDRPPDAAASRGRPYR